MSQPTILFESEHQELFALDTDLSRPFPLHVPSALGTLRYYVCLRVPEDRVADLAATRVHITVGGLRPDDVTLGWGDGVAIPQEIPSSVPGETWVLHSCASLSRGDGIVAFHSLPDGLGRAPFLLCTWPRFLSSGEADQFIACQSDPCWAPTGIPLGAIGCGKVDLCRDGRFRGFTGNNNQDMAFEEPDGLPGARLELECDGVRRAMASRPGGGVPPVPSLEADGAFPQMRLAAKNAFDNLDAEILATGAFAPHDLALSTLPGALFRWTVANRGTSPRTVACRFAWPNLVGRGGGIGRPEASVGKADGCYMYWDAPDAPTLEPLSRDGLSLLRFGNALPGPRASADGSHWLASAATADVACEASDPRLGALSRTFTLAPGASASFDMALVWEMPHAIDTIGVDRGHVWQEHFADGAAIAKALLDNADVLFTEGAALRNLLADAGLPEWLWRRLCNCCYPLVTNSVQERDGRFSINEGPTEMSGCYGTLDQRIGAHPATQIFFPELNGRELRQFASLQAENGGMPHDFGLGHLRREPDDTPWPDLTCSFVIQVARHAWTTGDTAFARDLWPKVRKAVLRHREWAAAGNGVAQVGSGLGTSYDGYHYHGTTAYMGTLWIAALDVARAWAAKIGDGGFIALTDGYADLARKRIETDLWNGSYHRAYADAASGARNDNLHGGTLGGEYYDRMLAGRDVLPADRLAATADALLRLNGNEAFAVPPDEVSSDLRTHTEYGWLPYVECFCMAPLAVLGRTEMLPVWKRILRAMDDEGRRPCDTRLMYQPVSGKPSWGSYYMTAPASWLVYDAINDFVFRADDGALRFHPMMDGPAALVHPLFWAKASRRGNEYEIEIARVWPGADEAGIRLLEVPAAADGPVFGGTPLDRESTEGVYARYALPGAVALRPGATLRWTLG
ncbi:MAG: GH116 family glycosyl hydrolase [Kiritimatiellia bacterium]|jgi:uncharacterized protein (DUF608 family)